MTNYSKDVGVLDGRDLIAELQTVVNRKLFTLLFYLPRSTTVKSRDPSKVTIPSSLKQHAFATWNYSDSVQNLVGDLDEMKNFVKGVTTFVEGSNDIVRTDWKNSKNYYFKYPEPNQKTEQTAFGKITNIAMINKIDQSNKRTNPAWISLSIPMMLLAVFNSSFQHLFAVRWCVFEFWVTFESIRSHPMTSEIQSIPDKMEFHFWRFVLKILAQISILSNFHFHKTYSQNLLPLKSAFSCTIFIFWRFSNLQCFDEISILSGMYCRLIERTLRNQGCV